MASTGLGRGSVDRALGLGSTETSNSNYGDGGGRGGVTTVVLGALLAGLVAVLTAAAVDRVEGWRTGQRRRRRHRRHQCAASTGHARGSRDSCEKVMTASTAVADARPATAGFTRQAQRQGRAFAALVSYRLYRRRRRRPE